MPKRMTSVPLVRFSGDPDDQVQPAAFLQNHETRMIELAYARTDWITNIEPYLELDSRAADWFNETLTDAERKGSWNDFVKLFDARFPSQKKERKSARMYFELLEGEVITHELILTRDEETNQPFHKYWAHKLLRLAKGAEIEGSKVLISMTYRNLPYALKRELQTDEYDDWEKFTTAIKDVRTAVLEVEAQHELDRLRLET